MQSLYLALMEEVKRIGVLKLVLRKEIWKNFDCSLSEETMQTKAKRLQLALECLKKIINEQKEVDKLYFLKKDVETLIDVLEVSGKEQDYNKIYEKICLSCEKEIATTDNFIVAYLQQAIRHTIQIAQEDEPLIMQEDESIMDDNNLEVEELDTSYCACMILKYQNMCTTEIERGRIEKGFWMWYVREAAYIQGIEIECDEYFTNETEKKVGEMEKDTIDSLDEFVKKISFDYEFYRAEKNNNVMTLEVLNLNDNDICPTCGQISNRSKAFWGLMKLGKIGDWKVQLKIKEHLYYCDNQLCKEYNFVPKEKIDYKEKMANFSYLKSIPENKEKICMLFDSI